METGTEIGFTPVRDSTRHRVCLKTHMCIIYRGEVVASAHAPMFAWLSCMHSTRALVVGPTELLGSITAEVSLPDLSLTLPLPTLHSRRTRSKMRSRRLRGASAVPLTCPPSLIPRLTSLPQQDCVRAQRDSPLAEINSLAPSLVSDSTFTSPRSVRSDASAPRAQFSAPAPRVFASAPSRTSPLRTIAGSALDPIDPLSNSLSQFRPFAPPPSALPATATAGIVTSSNNGGVTCATSAAGALHGMIGQD